MVIKILLSDSQLKITGTVWPSCYMYMKDRQTERCVLGCQEKETMTWVRNRSIVKAYKSESRQEISDIFTY
jgi:hypothetical protein